MATLPELDRLRIWRGIQRYWSQLGETLLNMTKADIDAAVDATDQWADDNSINYNLALPVTFRANATQEQKHYYLQLLFLLDIIPTYYVKL